MFNKVKIDNRINRIRLAYTILFIMSISAIYSQDGNLIKIYKHTLSVDGFYKQSLDTTDSNDYLYRIKNDYSYSIKKVAIIENLLNPKLEITFQAAVNFQGGFLIYNCKFFDEGVYITRYDCIINYGTEEKKAYTSKGYLKFNNFYAKSDTKFSNDTNALTFLKELDENKFFKKVNQKEDEEEIADLIKNRPPVTDIWPVFESYNIQYGKLSKRFQLFNPAQKTDNIEWKKNQNIANLFGKLYFSSK
jgi:hypothetical protein